MEDTEYVIVWSGGLVHNAEGVEVFSLDEATELCTTQNRVFSLEGHTYVVVALSVLRLALLTRRQ